MIQNANMRLESGTCNVCSAPCSSCMHLNRALTRPKAEESCDENSHLGEANQYSMDEGDGSSPGSRLCEKLKHAVSQTSIMLSVNSSHDSLSENAESRQTLSNKFEDTKCLEGLDDSSSCISRAGDANLANDSQLRNADRINISCSLASASHLGTEGRGSALSVDMSGLSEILSSKDADGYPSSTKVQRLYGQSQSSKTLSSSPSLMDLEKDSCSHITEKLSGCSVENVDLSMSLTKERSPIIVSGEQSLADNDSVINSSSNVSLKTYPKAEADTGDDVGNAKDEDHKFPVHEKVEEQVKLPGMQDTQYEDESVESDVVEHDVKVCDICGDAGREDLLAICSSCSDGAEHIYCMREMLQKVPEGVWFCEECKYAEIENKKLDVEEKKIHKVSSTSQVNGKRYSENVEVATSVKRQALESSTGSPKALSPKRSVPLSRESSFKSLDKGKEKVKPGHPMLICNHPGGDDIELARSPSTGPQNQPAKGTLLKSNSFHNFYSKPRVSDIDEVVPQKLKGGGEHISAWMISKSMSFKSSNLGRSNSNESKVKMLSSKSASALDLKGSRLARESGASDRKFQSRIDRPVVSSTMTGSVVLTSKGVQKLTPRGDSVKPSTVNNNRELKVNLDGKFSTVSKSMNNINYKSLESQLSSERMSTTLNETLQDVLPPSRETVNQIEKNKDSSSDHVRPGVAAASKSPFCKRCKDFGHPTECCTIGSTKESGAEISTSDTSSSREEICKGNRLKAAIQAALLKRPDIYKKKELPGQTEECPTLGTDLNCKVTSQDQVVVSNAPKNSISAEENYERQGMLEKSTSGTSKCSSTFDLKEPSFCSADFGPQPGKSDFIGPVAERPVMEDLFHRALAVSSVFSKMSAIPEYEYIWQGVFEVQRSRKAPDLYTGIQAHLSTCASPKVLEVVNKFLPEVSLKEVSRLSTWPSQFQQSGAKEDNIALYFFAKDIESYERHYKGLLDHMIRNDLALTGNFDGVELLIFPSNQLPEYSQRWNMLFFLWGVFRGRRVSHSDSEKKVSLPSLNVMRFEKDFPIAVMTVSETHCSPKRIVEEPIACDKAYSALPPSTYIDQGHIMKGTVPEIGQYQESKPPEAMETSAGSRILETETNSDTSVEQGNSLSLGTPVVSQEIGVASNISKDKISERMDYDEDQRMPKRKQRENDLNIDIEATFQGDLTVKGVNCQPPNDQKVEHIDLSDTVMQASAVSCPKLHWNEVKGKLDDGETSSKKLKTGSGGICGCCSSGGRDSFNDSFASLANDHGCSSSVEDKGCPEACDGKIICEDLGTMERTFFPLDTQNGGDSQLVLDSLSMKGPHEYVDQFQVGIPNLELALGGETKSPHKGMLPFFVGSGDQKNNHEKLPDSLAEEQEDDGVAASLSLSLSFPSSAKEPLKPVSIAELLPDGHRVNTPLLLFGRFPDK